MFTYGYDPQKFTGKIMEDPGTATWGIPQGGSGIGQGYWGQMFPPGFFGGGGMTPGGSGQGGPIMGPGSGGQGGWTGLPGGGMRSPWGGGGASGGPVMSPGVAMGSQTGQPQPFPQQSQQQGFGMTGFQGSPYFGNTGIQALMYSLFQNLFRGNPAFMYSPTNMSGSGSNSYPFSNIGSIY